MLHLASSLALKHLPNRSDPQQVSSSVPNSDWEGLGLGFARRNEQSPPNTHELQVLNLQRQVRSQQQEASVRRANPSDVSGGANRSEVLRIVPSCGALLA
jgi:hypothetical protein